MLYIKNIVFSGASVSLLVLLMTLPTSNDVDILWGNDGATQTVFRKLAEPDIPITMYGLVLWLNNGNIYTFNTFGYNGIQL